MHVAVIGAGITGVTTAYALSTRGYGVTVFERHSYPAMETSYANGGQLSASNAEVWNHPSTIVKGIKWMLSDGAPLLLSLKPGWHKYSWLAEFIAAIPKYHVNTVATARLAIEARKLLFKIAEQENIGFDLERRGILHFYHNAADFRHAIAVNRLLREAGLDRRPVTSEEIAAIEPALRRGFHGGFYTPSDSSGDIHKFTRGLAQACERRGVTFLSEVDVTGFCHEPDKLAVEWTAAASPRQDSVQRASFDAAVICAGVDSRRLAAMLGDRVNIYPVKGYSITVQLNDIASQSAAPWVSLLDDAAKIVTSRLGANRFRVAGTAEINGANRDIRFDRIQPLVRWTRANFRDMDTSAIIPWSGLRPMMPDMLPRVGRGRRPRVFYNTGHGHLGWTLSCATAEMIGAAVENDLGLSSKGALVA